MGSPCKLQEPSASHMDRLEDPRFKGNKIPTRAGHSTTDQGGWGSLGLLPVTLTDPCPGHRMPGKQEGVFAFPVKIVFLFLG